MAEVRIPLSLFFTNLDNVRSQFQKFTESLKTGITKATESLSKSDIFLRAMNFQVLASSVLQVAEYFNTFTEGSRRTESALADLSALTGIVGDELKKFKDYAKELALTFGTATSEQLMMFKGIISRLGVDFGSNSAAVKQFANDVNILAKASGLDATQAMDALTTAILQFNIDLTDHNKVIAESARMINVMAEGAKQGASEIPQIAEALKVAGVAASSAKLSFEETNAALQALARGGKFGAEAGTALRNVLVRMQSRLTDATGELQEMMKRMQINGAEVARVLTEEGLGPALRLLSAGLKNLESDVERNVALVKIFGEEGMTAGGILLNNVDLLEAWKAQLAGTNTALEQASIIMNTSNERINRFVNQVKMAISSVFSKLPGIFSMFSAAAVQILPLMQSLIQIKMIMGFEIVKSAGLLASGLLSKLLPSIVTTQVATLGLGASMKALAMATWSALGPILPFVLAVGGLVALGATLWSVLHKTAEEKKEDAEATLKATQDQIRYNEELKRSVQAKLELSKAWETLAVKTNRTAEEERAFQDLNLRMIETYGSLVSSASSVEEAIERVRKKNEENRKELDRISRQTFEFKVREVRERIDVLRAEVEIKTEELEELPKELGGEVGGLFEGIRVTFEARKIVENLKQAKTVEELQKFYGQAIDITQGVKDPKKKKEFLDVLRSFYQIKTEEFKKSEEAEREIFKLNWEQNVKQISETKFEFKGIEFDISNAKEFDALVGEIAKKNGLNLEIAKQIVLEEIEKTKQKKLQEKIENNLYNQAAQNLKQAKDAIKVELLDLLYKQKKGILLSEEEKKRLDILKIQAKQIAVETKQVEEIEKQVDNLLKVEEKRAVVQKSYKERLDEEFERRKLNIEADTKLQILAVQNLQEEEKRKMLVQIEAEQRNKLIKAYQEIYKISYGINLETGKGEVIWDKATKKRINDQKAILTIQNQYVDLLTSEVEKTGQIEEEVDRIASKKLEIEKVKIEIELGEIDSEAGKNALNKLYDELTQLAKEKIIKINEELEKIQVIPGEEKRTEVLRQELVKQKGILQEVAEWRRRQKEEEARSLIEAEKKLTSIYLEEIRKRGAGEIELLEKLLTESQKRYESRLVGDLERRRKIIEEDKNAQIITEERAQRKIEELDKEHQRNVQLMQIMNDAILQEARRLQAVEELRFEEMKLEERRRLLQEKGLMETEEYQKILTELDGISKQVKEKSSVLMSYSSVIQEGVSGIILATLEGNVEASKQGLKEVGATIIGILKKYAIATITQIILGQLGLLGAVSGLGALVFVPAIRAVVTASVNALLEPVFKSLAKFGAGGRVDRETVLIAGEAGTEWIVRDKDIERIIIEMSNLEKVFLTSKLAELQVEIASLSDRFVAVVDTQYEILKTNFIESLKQSQVKSKTSEVKVELEPLLHEIKELRSEIERWSGRIYVVSEDVKREIDKLQAKEARLKRL